MLQAYGADMTRVTAAVFEGGGQILMVRWGTGSSVTLALLENANGAGATAATWWESYRLRPTGASYSA